MSQRLTRVYKNNKELGRKMNHTLSIGTVNTLIVNRETANGLYLITGDNDTEVLLPNIYVKDSMQFGDTIDVFIYTDSEDRPVATTLTPKAMLGDFAFLKVVDTSKHGVFLDWGLPKDLFVPLREQKNLRKGDKRLFYLTLDEQTDRLIASQKIGKYLKSDTEGLEKNQQVSLLIITKPSLMKVMKVCFIEMKYLNLS